MNRVRNPQCPRAIASFANASYGHIFLREEDEMYVAKAIDEEFIGAANSLRTLRPAVERHALGL